MDANTLPQPQPIRIGKCIAGALAVGAFIYALSFAGVREAIVAVFSSLRLPYAATALWAAASIATVLGLWCVLCSSDAQEPELDPLPESETDEDDDDWKARMDATSPDDLQAWIGAMEKYRDRARVQQKIVWSILGVEILAWLVAPSGLSDGTPNESYGALFFTCFIFLAISFILGTFAAIIAGSEVSEVLEKLDTAKELQAKRAAG